MEPKERLVETGAFRVDRAKALAKLERYQLEDPWSSAWAWARMAVLSKAKRVEVLALRGVSTFRHDGRPLSEAVLLDPYAALLGGCDEAAEKLLAVGLLGLGRLEPAGVEVRSGGRVWTKDAEGGGRTERCEGEEGATIVISWERAAASGNAYRFSEAVRDALALANVELEVEGELMGKRHAARTAGAKTRGRAGRKVVACAGAGSLRVYRNGVLVRVEQDAGHAAWVNDDKLALDLTGCQAARNARLDETVRLASETALRLFPAPPAPRQDPRPSPMRDGLSVAIAFGIMAALGVRLGLTLTDGDRLLGALVAAGSAAGGLLFLYLRFRPR